MRARKRRIHVITNETQIFYLFYIITNLYCFFFLPQRKQLFFANAIRTLILFDETRHGYLNTYIHTYVSSMASYSLDKNIDVGFLRVFRARSFVPAHPGLR